MFPDVYLRDGELMNKRMGRPFLYHKLLDLDKSLSDKEHGVYVYRPIEVNGEVFDKTDIMCF